jgi:hypothetical protein
MWMVCDGIGCLQFVPEIMRLRWQWRWQQLNRMADGL